LFTPLALLFFIISYSEPAHISFFIPSITGKVELVYEGEQEGAGIVANNLVGKAIRTQFTNYFPDPEKERKKEKGNPYESIKDWFEKGNMVDLLFDCDNKSYQKELKNIPGLEKLIDKYQKTPHEGFKYFLMEFALFGLAEYSMLSKHQLERGMQFKDLFTSMFNMPEMGGDE
jgi:magnesium chelatase subunit I